MTSRSLFVNLVKEDIKRRVWSIVLLALAFFLGLPVLLALVLEDYTSSREITYIITNTINYVGPGSVYIIIATIGSAVVCGISGFCYLHSRKQVDFFHSIPVRREILFVVKYVNGLLIFLATLLVNVALSVIILLVKGYLYSEIVQAMAAAVGIHFLYYCMTYTVVIIAVMLTGNLIVSVLGTAVLLAYGPTLAYLKEMYFREFFSTYVAQTRLAQTLFTLSPIGHYAGAANLWTEKEGLVLHLLTAVIVTIVLLALAVLLYRKRPSEAAGSAMTYNISKPVIKFLLVLLLSLGGGILFRNIVRNNDDAWFIFGLIFTLLISHAVIEIIYQFDIRGALRHKRQLAYSAAAIALITCGFRFDLLHYDTYLPKREEIASMSVAVSELDGNSWYVDYRDGRPYYTSPKDYQLKTMSLKDFAPAYELAKQGILAEDNMDQIPDDTYSGYPQYFKYTLKNGREVYRSYTLDLKQNYEWMKKLYSNPEFKQEYYQIFGWKAANIGRISVRQAFGVYGDTVVGLDNDEEQYLAMDNREKEELFETYKEELNAMTLDVLRDDTPIATMQLEVHWPGDDSGDPYDNYVYNIYPSFTKTLALLRDLGFDAADRAEAVKVSRIDVLDERPYFTEVTDTTAMDGISVSRIDRKDGAGTVYTDQETIEQILPVLIDQDYYRQHMALVEAEDYVSVVVYAFNKYYNQEIGHNCAVRKGSMPELPDQN